MLRVRIPDVRDGKSSSPAYASTGDRQGRKAVRLAALTGLGLALGAGGAVLTVSLVQAEDDAGIRAFHRQEAATRQAQREATRAVTYPATSHAYAPARQVWRLPLFQSSADGRLAHPPIDLNPFRASAPAGAGQQKSTTKPRRNAPRLDTVSGAANVARTICVRMCDGFHSPIGYLNAQADLKAHEALCAAQNPGVPVKVFRVPAGASTIDGAVSSDGRTYGSLPVAYQYESAADPACRPAVVNAGERRVSLLRDITLRPGDSVVLDGRVRTFAGSSGWPYRTSDFRDFRSSGELTANDRRAIDDKVGISRREAELRSFKRQMRVREASLRDDTVASDTLVLRGALEPQGGNGTATRIVMRSPYAGD